MLDKKTKILLISINAWTEDISTGNTFSNFFSGWNKKNIAQIYCREEMPKNDICEKYYRMSESQIIRYFKTKKPIGKSFKLNSNIEVKKTENKEKQIYKSARKVRLTLFVMLRDFLWRIAPWKNDSLKKFLDEFQPDVIYMHSHRALYMHMLFAYIAKYTGAKCILFVGDDMAGYKKFMISPLAWIYQILIRRRVKKTVSLCSLRYAISQKLQKEYSKIFKTEFKLLRKGGEFSDDFKPKTEVSSPISLIYAGNMFFKRYNILAEIKKAMAILNQNQVEFVMNIYTGNHLTEKIKKSLSNPNVFIHQPVSIEELKKKYQQSDLALHVESFAVKPRLNLRLSFSTKILDCIQGGNAILAIGPKENAGIEYLKNEAVAIIVNSKDDIMSTLVRILSDPKIILKYSKKVHALGIKNHKIEVVRQGLYSDIDQILK